MNITPVAQAWKGARMRTPSGHKVYGMGAEYPSARRFTRRPNACAMPGSNAGMCISPFPIHGMDEAMGLGKSWLSAVVLIGGITGLLTAVDSGVRSLLVHLSGDRAWKTVQLGNSAGVFPDHV